MAGWRELIESNGILDAVSKSAPLLATVLGSPLAGLAISLLASVFHTDPKDIKALNEAMINDPNADLKIKEVELKHAEVLTQIASQNYLTEVDDRKDARKNAVLYKDFLRHMAYLVTCGFFGALLLLFLPIQINQGARELLLMLIGMLASKWQTIIDFFYGSSRSQLKRMKL